MRNPVWNKKAWNEYVLNNEPKEFTKFVSAWNIVVRYEKFLMFYGLNCVWTRLDKSVYLDKNGQLRTKKHEPWLLALINKEY